MAVRGFGPVTNSPKKGEQIEETGKMHLMQVQGHYYYAEGAESEVCQMPKLCQCFVKVDRQHFLCKRIHNIVRRGGSRTG